MTSKIIFKSELFVPLTVSSHTEFSKEEIDDFIFTFTCTPQNNHFNVLRNTNPYVNAPLNGGFLLDLNVLSSKPFTLDWICATVGGNLNRPLYFTEFSNGIRGRVYIGKHLLINNILKVNSVVTVCHTPKIVQNVICQIPTCIVGLLDDEQFKDFIFLVDDYKIHVHRCVLSVSSPVFSAMLQPHTKEFQEGKVSIMDFDYPTVKAAVQFMYKREIDDKLPIKMLLNLYKFADKYDLIDKDFVFEKLYKKINLTTIVEISNFSMANLIDELYNKCVDFFSKISNTNKINDFEDLNPQFIVDGVMKK